MNRLKRPDTLILFLFLSSRSNQMTSLENRVGNNGQYNVGFRKDLIREIVAVLKMGKLF